MTKVNQKDNGKGSLRLLQRLVNEREEVINAKLKSSIDIPSSTHIQWLSPKKEDSYAEYKDKAFIEKLSLEASIKTPLNEFWPNNGPQWDGLGKADDTVLLIEAKANIPELKSSSGASNKVSTQLIDNSLQKTKKYTQSTSDLDWSKHYYQYANRLAHLYYFRILNDITSYLVFIYFIGDTLVDGPSTKEEWQEAIQVMKDKMSLPEQHPLSDYIVDVFIHVDEI